MTFFACLLDTNNQGIGDRARTRMTQTVRTRGVPYRWKTFDGAEVLIADDLAGAAVLVTVTRTHMAVGKIRLHNREEIATLVQPEVAEPTDLDLALALISQRGPERIQSLLGDFAFVIWDSRSRSVVAALDTFGTRHLYYTMRDGLTLFSSRAETISVADTYDRAYLADAMSIDCVHRDLTVYRGVNRVMPASFVAVRNNVVTTHRYWSVPNLLGTEPLVTREEDAIHVVKDLFTTSVRLRLEGGNTWAELSGGLDSSSVVSVSSWLAQQNAVPEGLAGTVTIVAGAHTGADERCFSDAVVERWRLRNELVVDPPMWDDQHCTRQTLPDQPTGGPTLDAAERQLYTRVRAAGGRALLTGWGSDQLFSGSMIYLADQLTRGRVRRTLSEMAHIAALGRVSFWAFAYDNAVLPLLPSFLQRRTRTRRYAVPPWFRWNAFEQLGVHQDMPDSRTEGPWGEKYNHYLMAEAALLDRGTTSRANGDDLDIGHPFLYRPLVEFALHLSPQLCARPLARKWVLREAMRGILPEKVRTRVGKGGTNKDLQLLFAQPPASFALLAREPILADLGLVDGHALRSAVDSVRTGRNRDDSMPGELMRTLSIEAWLQVRSGRWPHGVIANQTARQSHPSTDVSVTKGESYEKVFQAGRDGQ